MERGSVGGEDRSWEAIWPSMPRGYLTFGETDFLSRKRALCVHCSAFPPSAKNLNLKNVGVEGWLRRHSLYTFSKYMYVPQALGHHFHPSSSSPIKQALREHTRGYFGLWE